MELRFGLKFLLGLTAVCAVGFASIGYFGAHASLGLFVLVLAIAAHVLGNAMGTRLRELGNRRPEADEPGRSERIGRLAESDFAPASPLRQRSSLGRPIVIVTIGGTLVGGVCGGLAFMRMMRPPLSPSIVILGFFAAALLSGIWSFIAGSFVQVAGGALWQATRESKRE